MSRTEDHQKTLEMAIEEVKMFHFQPSSKPPEGQPLRESAADEEIKKFCWEPKTMEGSLL